MTVRPHAPNRALQALVERFPKARIAVLGDLVADEYVLGDTDRISREAPVLIVRYEHSEVVPGCAANVVMNLCALGACVRPLGLVGDDALGRELSAQLARAGADTSGIAVAAHETTASKTRILAGGKNTRRQQLVRLDRDGPGAPTGKPLRALLSVLKAAARDCDAILVSDYGLGLLRVLRTPLLSLCDDIRVCVDARYDLRGYRGVFLVKPNEVELEQALGLRIGDDPHALDHAAHALRAAIGAENLLVTRGKNGMALVCADGTTQLILPHGSREAVDVTGAGDTVMAAMTLALATGADALLAARLANVAGALVVQKPGTATVTTRELRDELCRGAVLPAELHARAKANANAWANANAKARATANAKARATAKANAKAGATANAKARATANAKARATAKANAKAGAKAGARAR